MVLKLHEGDLPSGLVDTNLPCNSVATGSIPYQGTKIPQAVTAKKTGKNKKNPRAQRGCVLTGLGCDIIEEVRQKERTAFLIFSLPSSSSEDNNSCL